MKARITIRLVPHVSHTFTMYGMSEYRTDGKDDWEVILLVQTPENQITKHTFRNYDKTCALKQAYKALGNVRISVWIDQFVQEQLEKYADLAEYDETFKTLLWGHLERVAEGKITRERFLEVFPVQAELYAKRKQRKQERQAVVNKLKESDPVKWWQFWRGNK